MLTFEMIRELERQEKANRKMQKLPENITDEIRDYIKRKEKNTEKTSTDILELENVKNAIRRFFELREHKLVEMAISAARTGRGPENLTKKEERVYYQLLDSLKDYREAFFLEINREEQKEAGQQEQKKEEKINERIIYRVKKDLQEFVGPDMKTYRLVRGEIVNLPKPLKDLLLKEGVIEEIAE